MKHFCKIYTLLMAIALLLPSCESFLDITPAGQNKRDDQLADADGIEDALYGCYASMRNTSLYGRELSFQTMEVLAQYLWCQGNTTITPMQAYDYQHSNVKGIFENMWTAMYKNISYVNSVLDCDLVSNAKAYPYTIYRGEALAMRAYMHFDLLRVFTKQITLYPDADGIPYATKFSLDTPDFVSAAKCYENILKDLHEAEQLLANEKQYEDKTAFMKNRNIHLNLYAVKGLLARVYLTMGNKEKAAEYALDVIQHSGKRLSTKTEIAGDLAGILSNNETLFGIYYAEFYSVVSPKLQQQVSRSSLDPRNDIMTFYEEKVTGLDFRTTAYFTATSSVSSTGYRLSKLTDVYELANNVSARPSSKILGINMIRLPEMYYIAAEALLDTDYDKAVSLFNDALTHRGLEPLENWPEPQNHLTVGAITDERNRELIGEGQAFFNMKRLNLAISSVDGNSTFQPSNDIYVVPIPDIEFDYRN